MSQPRTGRTASAALVLALVAALVLWLRNRARPIQVDDPPEWPPLPPLADPAPNDATAAGDPAAPAADAPAAAPAPVDPEPTPSWRAPNADGTCPDSHPIKAKDSSGIFHVPDGRFYERTNPDRCYADAASAIADGYRQSKS